MLAPETATRPAEVIETAPVPDPKVLGEAPDRVTDPNSGVEVTDPDGDADGADIVRVT